MPELPEVETLCRGLLPQLVGRVIRRVDVRETRLRYPVDAQRLQRCVEGTRVSDVTRRAKYLLVHLDASEGPGCVLMLHLGMTGNLFVLRPEREVLPHTHLVFSLDDGRELRFRDPRRFGAVDVIEGAEVESHPRFVDLGVEPLSDDFDGEQIYRRTRGLRKPVKNWLMDSRQVAGVGNIYASEALWRAGVHPERAAGRVGRERWVRVTQAVRRVLSDAIDQGGTTLSDFRDAEGREGYFQVHLNVYGHDGQPCPACGAIIRRRVLAGRSTFYCPRCQR